MSMTEEEIRLRCVEIAAPACGADTAAIAAAARVLADFVLGTNDAEVIRAARVLAEKVRDGR